MDFGFDEMFLSLLKEHWLYILSFIVFIALFKFLFDELIPELIENSTNKKRFDKGKSWRSDQELLRWLQSMKSYEFEKYTAELFKRLGYVTEVTRASRDGGIDVILEKDGTKSYVQCKKYHTSKVTEPQVREFYGALADKLSNGQGFVVTTNIFTLDAQLFAKDKPIELIDGPKLVEYIRLTEKTQSVEIPMQSSLVCPKCGGELKERKSKYGKFIGCSSYPKCTYKETLD